MTDKTIIAQSTPQEISAIAIIRLSGKKSLELVKKAFSGFKSDIKSRTMYYGTLDAGGIFDDCLAVYFKAPHSYTGEDMVEINCHGNPVLTRSIIEYFIKNGASMAEPGEFTARAFENGKLDLAESEGVIDLINAQSEAALKGAYSQLTGQLSKKIAEVQKIIKILAAKTEAAIDYPEEDVEEMTKTEIYGETEEALKEINKLIDTYESGKVMRDGVKVCITGEPNVGKSMLMNALLGYERAIVTEIAGTTRDTLSESYIYKGIKFNITDTAGIRDTSDKVEKIGVERAEKAVKESDIVLSVTEAGKSFIKEEFSGPVIYVENKTDIYDAKQEKSVKISAKNGDGIENLKEQIYLKTAGKMKSYSGAVINNLRHLEAAQNAAEAVKRALLSLDKIPVDLIADDFNEAYRELGKITGEISSAAIVNEIFSRFCVGK